MGGILEFWEGGGGRAFWIFWGGRVKMFMVPVGV